MFWGVYNLLAILFHVSPYYYTLMYLMIMYITNNPESSLFSPSQLFFKYLVTHYVWSIVINKVVHFVTYAQLF